MTPNNQEIELKFAISSSDFQRLLASLPQKATFVKKNSQIDTYYNAPDHNFLAPQHPHEWLSVRKRGSKIILNYKHFHPEGEEVFTHCDEYESEVSEQMESILKALNFRELVTVDKERTTFVTEDFEIALDNVKGQGYFIEIEALKIFNSVEETRVKLFEFAQSLGLDTSKPDNRGYPYLLLEKKGLLNKINF